MKKHQKPFFYKQAYINLTIIKDYNDLRWKDWRTLSKSSPTWLVGTTYSWLHISFIPADLMKVALISQACLHTNAAVANAERVFIMKLSARVEDWSSITTEEDFWSATILIGYRDSGDLVVGSEMVASSGSHVGMVAEVKDDLKGSLLLHNEVRWLIELLA